MLHEPFLKLQFALRDPVSVLTKIDPFEFISRNLINVIWNLAQQQLPCSKIGKATHFAFWIGAACNIGMTPNAAAFTRFVTYLSSSVTSVASWRSLKSKSIISIIALYVRSFSNSWKFELFCGSTKIWFFNKIWKSRSNST